MSRSSKRFIFRRFFSATAITLLIAFISLSWFARQPDELRQRVYRWLEGYDYISYKLYYFSNNSASITDFMGITGHDCVVEYRGRIPVKDLVVGGYPQSVRKDAIPEGSQYLKRTGFTLCYVPELRHPLWVASKVHDGKRRLCTKRPSFKKDPAARNSPKPSDYAKSGYDRGHMAPNRAITTCYGPDAQRETFLLSNICPQRPGLNRGPWRKTEHLITDIWPSKYGDIWVITGAHSSRSPKKLPSGISIPDGFYKIILARKNYKIRVLAVYMDQDSGYRVFPRNRIVSVDKLEKMTGLDFLSELPDDIEQQLESQTPTRLWSADFRGNIKLLISHFKSY